MDHIRLYWKNATAAAVGDQHGIAEGDLKQLAPRIKTITRHFHDERKAGRLNYRNLPYDDDITDAIHREVEHFRDRCEILVILGIGGGALGSVALQNALNPYTYNLMSDRTRPGPQVFVVDNVDPDQVKSLLELVAAKAKKTVINVISKNGETVETAAQFFLFRDLLQSKLGKKFNENVIATTDPDTGVLRQLAKQEGYRTLDVPAGVVGRFGILSAVGLFGAALTGIDIDAIHAGAREMDKRVKEGDLLTNPAAMIAAIHYLLLAKGKSISVLMPYSTALASFGDWLGQLMAESLGKRDSKAKKGVYAGITPISARGTTDQHSQIQLYREGPFDKLITLVEVERFGSKLAISAGMKDIPNLGHLVGSNLQTLINSEKLATEYALLESHRPTMTLLLPQISPEVVGQFIYLYETAVSYLAALLEVDAYSTPAVQLGKEGASALMGDKAYADVMDKLKSSVLKRDPKFTI
jgi:glucose-6-phosphate isomerase